MSNLLQSTQTTATSAPQYYTDYLSNLATSGTAAQQAAQYVGAQPLQTEAFQNVENAGTAYQPTLTAAGNTLTNATQATSPLSAASGYLQQATQNPAQEASNYVSSYLMPAAQSLSDINQENILNNLAPGATAGAVGSGQFGSQRGAQVLGQTEQLANQATQSQIENLLNTGYQNALQEAVAQNQIANTAGSTAATAAGTGQSNLTQAGTAQGNLAAQNQNLGLADVNALATLGGQQQTIAQNQQLFPLTTLSSLASLMQGQSVPTTTATQLNTSPLSAISTLGSLTAALNTSGPNGSQTPWQNIMQSLGLGSSGSAPAVLGNLTYGSTIDANGNPVTASGGNGNVVNVDNYAGAVFPSNTSPTGYVDGNGNAINSDGSAYDPTAG